MKPLEGAISAYFNDHAPSEITTAIKTATKRDILDATYPYDRTWKKSDYEEAIGKLQLELVKFQHWVKTTEQRIAIVFEGRDAAGKGGTIKRFRENLNPRSARVVALSKPTETEAGQWYFQRYIKHLPTKGEIVFFDRSWYNRAVVEDVFGFCTKEQRERFFNQTPAFEEMLKAEGISLSKIWLNVGRAEQLRRFLAREADPLKGWKLSWIDAKGLEKWDMYSAAIAQTFERTHTPSAPWTIIRSDDKRRARVNAIQAVLSKYDYDGKDEANLGQIDPMICGDPSLWNR